MVFLGVLVGVQVQRVLRQAGGGDLVAHDEAELGRDAQRAQVQAGAHHVGDHAGLCRRRRQITFCLDYVLYWA